MSARRITSAMVLAALAAPGCKGSSSEAASTSGSPKVAFLLATLQDLGGQQVADHIAQAQELYDDLDIVYVKRGNQR